MTEAEARALGEALKGDGYANLVRWNAQRGWWVEVQRRDGVEADSLTMAEVEGSTYHVERLVTDEEVQGILRYISEHPL